MRPRPVREPKSHFPIPRAHAAHRSWPSTLGGLALFSLFPALVLFVPGVPSLLAIERSTGVAVAAAWLVLFLAASSAYHRGGLSHLYLVLDFAESLALQLGICLLVYCSGSALSILWLAYLAHVQLAASVGLSARNMLVVAAGPLGLALAFWLTGQSGSAWLTLLVGAVGTHAYHVMARVYSDLEQVHVREAALKETLARLRVDEERTRISRDLHDRVATELAALTWRLRSPSLTDRETQATAEELQTEMRRLGERIRGALAGLRQVVLDLRREPHGWEEMLAALRELCRDLCEGRALVFEADQASSAPLSPSAIEDLQCIVLELVRNAVTHAEPRQIRVRIRVGDGVRVSVADDGCGLAREHARRASGGLANMRLRVERHGGQVEIQTARPGTRITFSLPAVHDG